MMRIWQIAKPEHGRLLLSVVLAMLGVLSGIIPYISAAKIISGIIAGNKEMKYYIVFVFAAFIGFGLKSLLYAKGLCQPQSDLCIVRRDPQADLCKASENAARNDYRYIQRKT